MNKPLFRPEIKWRMITLLIIFLLGMFFIYRSWSKPLGDFGNYYYGSYFLRTGTFNTDVYDAWKFNRMVDAAGAHDLFLNYTPVPPATAVLFVPLTFMQPCTAKIVFGIAGLILFLFTLNVLLRSARDSCLLLFLPGILLIPLKSELQEGQLYLLLFSLIAGGFLFAERKQHLLAAICFAIAIHLKIFPAVFLFFFLFTAQYRTLLYTLGVVVAIFFISMIFIPAGILNTYCTEVLPRLMNNEINDPFATAYQSFSVFLRQLFVHDQLLNPAAPFDSPFTYTLLNGVFNALVLLTGISITLDRRFGAFLKFAGWALIMLLMSGYGATYGLLLLLFPAMAILQDEKAFGRFLLPLLVLAILICAIPAGYFSSLSVVLRFPRLWLMLTFFLVFLLFIRPLLKWKYLLLTAIFPLTAFVLSPKQKDNSGYLLDREQAILTGNYKADGSELRLECYGRNGYEIKHVPFTRMLNASEDLSCDGHSIRSNGKMIYESKSRVEMPSWLNDDTLVFLSDKDRGVGMFALRYIQVNKSSSGK